MRNQKLCYTLRNVMIAGSLATALMGCGNQNQENSKVYPIVSEDSEQQSAGLVDTIAGDPNFSTLTAALTAADLLETLENGSFTVFAPTDEAFAKIPSDTLQAILADKKALQNILLYHVVGGELIAEDVLGSDMLRSAQGQDLAISLRDGKPYIENSMIINTDRITKNGVIHTIDSVLVPKAEEEQVQPKSNTIADIAIANPEFSTLVELLVAADLVDAVSGETKLTVFAPTNAAFQKIPAKTLESLLADKEALRQVLLYHVVPGALKAEEVLSKNVLSSLSNKTLNVCVKNGKPFINDSMIQTTDIEASNGVIHVIDTVLIPQT